MKIEVWAVPKNDNTSIKVDLLYIKVAEHSLRSLYRFC